MIFNDLCQVESLNLEASKMLIICQFQRYLTQSRVEYPPTIDLTWVLTQVISESANFCQIAIAGRVFFRRFLLLLHWRHTSLQRKLR